MWSKWQLGGKALDVLRWARDVAVSIDVDAVLRIAFKVFEIERDRRGIPGAEKLTELLDWLRREYPNVQAIASVIAFVKALVALVNAVGLFRSRANLG
jgi:hypothetical protein